MSIKDLTILHSNDMHGHFTGKKDENGKLTGSLAQVSGYVNQVKAENPNTLYCVAGDVFQGSLIDSDFQGLSTANILNMLDMDLMSLGNHELDYGISHMMFVDKCLDSTIINANFKVKGKDVHLFQPYKIVEINGMKLLFIGIGICICIGVRVRVGIKVGVRVGFGDDGGSSAFGRRSKYPVGRRCKNEYRDHQKDHPFMFTGHLLSSLRFICGNFRPR